MIDVRFFRSRGFRSALGRQHWNWSAFIKQVCDAEDWVSQQHARPGPAHYIPHLLAHLNGVAVHDTLRARRFRVAEYAAFKTPLRIVEQRETVGAEKGIAMVAAAVHPDHYIDGLQFPRASDGALVGGESN